MEAESGAKIAIRGKGSVKEGKGKSDAAHASNQDEDLHCLIMAETEDKINKAKVLIAQVIETVSASILPHSSAPTDKQSGCLNTRRPEYSQAQSAPRTRGAERHPS